MTVEMIMVNKISNFLHYIFYFKYTLITKVLLLVNIKTNYKLEMKVAERSNMQKQIRSHPDIDTEQFNRVHTLIFKKNPGIIFQD